GPLSRLASVVALRPVRRFPDSKHVVSYVGLAPTLHASADKYRLGKITKQGSTLLRFVLGQAAAHAASRSGSHPHVSHPGAATRALQGQSRGRPPDARAAVIMLRAHIDYHEFRRRGPAPPPAPG